jgi:DeoR/GlpR family transcriptional regulator of sugar metabolism
MAAFIKEAAKNANERIIDCTASAFEKTSFYKSGQIGYLFDKLITNHTISDKQKNNIFKANIQLYTSIDIFEGRL